MIEGSESGSMPFNVDMQLKDKINAILADHTILNHLLELTFAIKGKFTL